MLKKYLLSFLCMLPMPGWSAWGTGLYVGGGLGPDFIDFQQQAYVSQPPSQNPFSVLNDTDNAAQGLFETAFIGYSFTKQFFYLAGEANLNYSNAQFNTTNREFDHLQKAVSDTTFQFFPIWGGSAITGIVVPGCTLLYSRFGYEGGIMRINTTDTSLTNNKTVLHGVRFGLGVEKQLYTHFGIRMEYSHSHYQTNTITHIDISNGATTLKETRITPEDNRVEFSLVYRFC